MNCNPFAATLNTQPRMNQEYLHGLTAEIRSLTEARISCV
jgi:hypothetical protein